jgi:hypothetical protein
MIYKSMPKSTGIYVSHKALNAIYEGGTLSLLPKFSMSLSFNMTELD